MEVILASPRGFCAGVDMAIDALNKVVELVGAPVYAYHEIVHNRWVVDQFTRKGVIFVESIADIPTGATVVYSAHGVGPAIREAARERNLRAIDATCPLVAKVHMEALRFKKLGYHILYIGHQGHQEVVGTMGEAPEVMTLIEKVEDIQRLDFSPTQKLAFLTQTTLSLDDTRLIVDGLKRKFPWIEGPKKDDICYATQNRQDAVKQLSPEADLVLVLGSQNSSNSQRLVEVARNQSVPAYLVGSVVDLKPEWFQNAKSVLVTAGASAPEPLLQELVGYLKERFSANVTERTLREESVSFPFPKELHQLMQSTVR